MARPFNFPDPNDRSINSPSFVVSQAQVLGNYNQATGDSQTKVTDKVKTWFTDQAQAQGWSSAEFHGSQCLLSVNLQIV